MSDTMHGNLNVNDEGMRRMALLPTFSNRLLRDERGDVKKIEIDDMPTFHTVPSKSIDRTKQRMESVQPEVCAVDETLHTPANSD